MPSEDGQFPGPAEVRPCLILVERHTLTLGKSAIPGFWCQRTKLLERVHEADTDDQRVQHGLKDILGQSGGYQS